MLMLIRFYQDITRSHEIIRFLVKRNLSSEYKNMILGYTWWILNPLLFVAVYAFLVTMVFQVKIEYYPLFVFCGLLPWRAFSMTISRTATLFPSYEGIIKQVNFPKISLLVSSLTHNIINFLAAFPIIFLFMLIYKIRPSESLLFLPVIILLQLLLTLGVCGVTAVLGAYFPDFSYVLRVLILMGIFLSPVLYPLSRVPQKYLHIYMLNPLATILPAYRDVIINGCLPFSKQFLLGCVEIIIVFVFGIFIFYRHEREIIKVL
jgi:ABC-type polysaccharide/polyol phosphate export permease